MAYNKVAHFELEKRLAEELRNSTLQQRRVLYGKLYNDLFSAFPEIAHSDISVEDRLAYQLKILKGHSDQNKIFMEIGAGDCLLGKAMAPYFKKIIAYEVADAIPFIEGKPENFELKIFNGFDMHEQPSSVDIIYSNQLFEHLHPDDALPLLYEYYSYLNTGGKLFVFTPHQITGPHDISRSFSDFAEGFHMKEYTYVEMKSLLLKTGFTDIKGYIGHRKFGYAALPISILIGIEKVYKMFPVGLRKKMRNNSLVLNLFGLKVIARKKNNPGRGV